MSPNEPKTPVIRTLPPIDVVFESDGRPSDTGTLRVNADDLAALRRIALGAAPAADSKPPESRPSLPVRAAKGTARGAFIGSAVVGLITLAGALDPDVVRGLVAIARVVGQMAAALRAGFAQ